MNNIKDILEICERNMDGDTAAFDELYELLDITYKVFTHIDKFVQQHSDCYSEYAMDYLMADKIAHKDGMFAFANILEELEDYIKGE